MHNAIPRAAMLLLALLLTFVPLQADASFSSMYVFGDGVSATNDPTASDDPLYYGKRNCNGRVWVEVLWQWQGHAYDEAKNKSYFGNTSDDLLVQTANFTAADTATALFVIWCANADFVEFLNTSSSAWTNFINSSVSRHTQAVTTLYNKGARTILMPNAVDIMAVPFYNFTALDKAFIRQRVIEFNTAFKTALVNSAATKPGLQIVQSDTFTFFDQVLANPSNYGLQNPFPTNSAVWDLENPDKEVGPGIDFVFWDDFHPTAAFQMHLAEFFKQAVLPVEVHSIAVNSGTVEMLVANIPIGRSGSIQGCVDMQTSWQNEVAILEPVVGGNTMKTITFPSSGSQRFYRVGFPVVWTWP